MCEHTGLHYSTGGFVRDALRPPSAARPLQRVVCGGPLGILGRVMSIGDEGVIKSMLDACARR